MAIFSQRARVYKGAVILLFIALLLALWGVFAPGWLRYYTTIKKNQYLVYEGLWWSCRHTLADCTATDLSGGSGKFHATLALCCSGLVTLLVTSLITLIQECCTNTSTFGRLVGLGAVLAGAQLFIGCMLFISDGNDYVYTGPSFDLTLTSSIIAIAAGFMMRKYINYQRPLTYITSDIAPTTPLLHQEHGNDPTSDSSIYKQGNVYYSSAGGQGELYHTGDETAQSAPPPANTEGYAAKK